MPSFTGEGRQKQLRMVNKRRRASREAFCITKTTPVSKDGRGSAVGHLLLRARLDAENGECLRREIVAMMQATQPWHRDDARAHLCDRHNFPVRWSLLQPAVAVPSFLKGGRGDRNGRLESMRLDVNSGPLSEHTLSG